MNSIPLILGKTEVGNGSHKVSDTAVSGRSPRLRMVRQNWGVAKNVRNNREHCLIGPLM